MKRVSLGMIAIVVWAMLICTPVRTMASSSTSSAGESAASFYKGKTVEFVVTYNPGGGYDTVARLIAPFLAKHTGATVIVKNEPGAGGKVAMNRLAKEDNGLSIITTKAWDVATAQVYGETGVRFDLRKFNWLATISKDRYPIVVGKKSGYKSILDLQKAKEVKFGADTRTDGMATRPMVMGYILGVNVKLVTGYKGTADMIMAMLKGETDGASPALPALLPYIASQDAIPLVIMGHQRYKRFPNIPTIFEIKKLGAKEQRIADIAVALDAIGRPVATTPGVPPERVAFLEAALKKALEEPELLEKFEKIVGEPVDYTTGKETAAAIELMMLAGEEKAIFGKFMGVEGY